VNFGFLGFSKKNKMLDNSIMPIKDIDGGLVWTGYYPAVIKGAKALPKDTYATEPFNFGGANIRSFTKKFRTIKR
jgi:hypothetical protein